MAEREKLIELKDLQISFGTGKKKFVAVDHVNFDIYKGETFSLVGESGSGKQPSVVQFLELTQPPLVKSTLKVRKSTARSPKSWIKKLSVNAR